MGQPVHIRIGIPFHLYDGNHMKLYQSIHPNYNDPILRYTGNNFEDQNNGSRGTSHELMPIMITTKIRLYEMHFILVSFITDLPN